MSSDGWAPRVRTVTDGAGSEDDAALARRASSDAQAFAELYRRHLEPVYHYHLSRIGNAQDAQDLTSQTFLAALESIQSYRGQGAFLAWLYGIAGHKLADHFRKHGPADPLDAAEHLPDPDPFPEHVAALQLQMSQVARAIAALSPDQAEALTMRLSGASAREIGQVMGKSEAAVKMLVHRGLCNLKDRLACELEVLS